MRRVALSRVKDDFSKFLRMAEREEVIITRHGRPAGVMIGFKSEDDWFDYRLENDPRFLRRIAAARESLRAGRGVKLDRDVGRARAGSSMTPRIRCMFNLCIIMHTR